MKAILTYRRCSGALKASAIAAFMALISTVTAQALECPVAHPSGSSAAIRQPESAVRRDADLLAAQGVDVVSEIVARLRQTNPAASDAEITNYLVTAYCPVIAQNAALSEGQKRERLAGFSSSLMLKLKR